MTDTKHRRTISELSEQTALSGTDWNGVKGTRMGQNECVDTCENLCGTGKTTSRRCKDTYEKRQSGWCRMERMRLMQQRIKIADDQSPTHENGGNSTKFLWEKNTNRKAEVRPQQPEWTGAGSSQNRHPAPAAVCRIAIVFAWCEHISLNFFLKRPSAILYELVRKYCSSM